MQKFSPRFLLPVASILHLILFLLESNSIDWNIQWQAAVEIVNGTPLYEQQGVMFDGTAIWLPPHHFPVFFYLMALLIIIFGYNEIIGKLFLWLCVEILFFIMLFYLKPKKRQDQLFIILLYFFHPLILGVSYFSPFDPFVFLFLVSGLVLSLTRNHQLIGGIILGLGALVKFLPIFVLVPLSVLYLRKGNFKNMVLVISTSLAVFVGGIVLFIQIFDNFLVETILWQSSRVVESNAIWIYLFPRFLNSPYFILFEVLVLFVVVVILYLLPIVDEHQFVWMGYTLFVLAFIFSYRSLYPHYGYWFTISLLPICYELFRKEKYSSVILLLIPNLLFVLGNILCNENCATTGPLGVYENLLVILIYLSLVLQFLLIILIYLKDLPTEIWDHNYPG